MNYLNCIETGAVLPMDKPYGWSSFDVLRYVQRQITQRSGIKGFKIGHAGTLDPLATGVLLLCLGKATRQAQTLQDERKEYLATICLGATTPSFDLETEPDSIAPYEHITQAQAEAVLQQQVGEQEQMPPNFSAKNVNGQRAYQLARKGQEVILKPSAIHIYSVELLRFDLPYLVVRIACSKGTYIRAFARDVGRLLDCGAHLAHLRRTAVGSYTERELCTIDQIFE